MKKDKNPILKGVESAILNLNFVRLFVPAVLGFSLGNSVLGIQKERPYAMTQLVVSVAGLGYYFKKRFDFGHKKTGRNLKRLFSDKNMHLGMGSIWVSPDYSNPFFKPNPEGVKYRFDMQEWGPAFDALKGDVWSSLMQVSLFVNHEKGVGIKDSLLNAIHYKVDDVLNGEELSKKKVFSLIDSENLKTVFLLKMCQAIYEKVDLCLSDEAVLKWLKVGLNDKTKLYNSRPDEKVLSSFFNRAPYASGKKGVLNAIQAGQCASLAGLVASGTMGSLFGTEGVVSLSVGVVSSLAYLRIKNQHVKQQMDRYSCKAGDFAKVQLLERFEDADWVVWSKKEERLTPFFNLKLISDIYDSSIKLLEENSNLTCANVAVGVYRTLVESDEPVKRALNLLQSGMTLEQIALKTDLKVFHKAMTLNMLIGWLKGAGNMSAHTFAYHLKYSGVDYSSVLKEEEKIFEGKIASKKAKYERLCEKGMISEEEKNKHICSLYEKEERIVGQAVTKYCVLPYAIKKLRRSDLTRFVVQRG